MATTDPSIPTTGSKKKPRCILVSYPKVIFFYPLMIVAFVCGCLALVPPKAADAPVAPVEQVEQVEQAPVEDPLAEPAPVEKYKPFNMQEIIALIFIITFFLNILVISFDFSGIKAIAVIFGVTILVLLAIVFEDKLPVLDILNVFIHKIMSGVTVSAVFYFCIAFILAIMVFGGIIHNTLWDRWIVEPNRLIHIRGIMRESTEYPVIDLQVEKRIDDVFEYMLLLSGTLTFRPNPTTPPIQLENIPWIASKERKIQKIVREYMVTKV
ncbi:MAG TPA: hypothetical protein PLR86_02895 [Planctomycetota bacterium]|nr:hypothetical protein [Planctomycetota bacterium]